MILIDFTQLNDFVATRIQLAQKKQNKMEYKMDENVLICI